MVDTKDFDLIEYPLEVSTCDMHRLDKHGDTYYMRIADAVYSKKVLAPRSGIGGVFLHVEVEDGCVCIRGCTENVYRFDVPADFYVPVSPETARVYEDIYTGIISSDIEDMHRCAESFARNFYSENVYLPVYPIPTITRIGVSDDRKFCNLLVERERCQHAVVVRHGEETPACPKEGVASMVERFANGSFNPLEFLRETFAEHPVLRMECLRRIYCERLASEHRKRLTFNRFRSFVPAVAYFMNSGPWYKTWIRFGVDPSRSGDMYRYQVIALRIQDTGTQLFENPKIVAELEKAPETFISDSCSHRTGFLTPYGIALIKRLLKRGLGDEESDDGAEFELFD